MTGSPMVPSAATGQAGTGDSGGTVGSWRTIRSGDAVRRKLATGPAQRQAAHSARATTEGGGP